MSEFTNTVPRSNSALLTTVCATAILSFGGGAALAQDVDRPTVWVELGAQFERVVGQGRPFAPQFIFNNPDSSVLKSASPIQAQRPPLLDFGGQGSISFQPKRSNWTFNVAVRYGRSESQKHVDHQTHGTHAQKYTDNVPGSAIETQSDFADTHVKRREGHAVVDFSAGKDVGLGMFHRNISSVLNFGIRFAQFSNSGTFDARARPDLQVKYAPSAGAPTRVLLNYFHTYHATGSFARSFHGLGPSLSWNGSLPLVGVQQDGAILFDWGINAAALFGKQKAHVEHRETGHYLSPLAPFRAPGSNYVPAYTPRSNDSTRIHSVTVPNVGAFVGVSYRIANFEINTGYRADLFFNAVDSGLDARKSETLGFYGPFATISIGLGG